MAITRFDDVDEQVRPQDDLFGHVNGRWYDQAEVPADLPMVGGFVDLALEAEAAVGDILRESAADPDAPAGSDRRKIGDLFASFMDEDAVESLGAAPLADDLAAIEALSDVGDLGALHGRLQRGLLDGLVLTYVNTDDRRSDRYIVNVVQGGIGLPDESYYRLDPMAELRERYEVHIARMLGLLGWSDGDATDAAARILALETRLAAGHWDNVRTRDVIASYNLTPFDELRTLAPAFDWDGWRTGLGATGDDVAELLVRQPDFLTALSDALGDVPLDDWKAWLTFHVTAGAAKYLSAAFVEESFDFNSRALTGTEENKERWKRGVALCNGLMGEAVGEVYVERHFPPEAKAQMDELVANLVEAYRVSISRLDWMTDETRERALAKLGQFRSKVGYPDEWRDYSSLEIRRDDLVGNVRRASAFETDRQLRKLGGPVDRNEWFMTPQTVNAYYNPGANEICFPAAILQPPFFEAGADPALNYGGIGAVIGHEIGHGFDDQGSHFDGDGNLSEWWTDEDREAFKVRTDALVAQYDGLAPRQLPDEHVNGALTLGENIGDLGGLTIGLLAYRLSLHGEEPSVIDGRTGVQRLLCNWGLIWRIKVRPEMAQQLLAVDVHSPADLRANIVRNLDEFHEAYGTTPDDALWLDPADRVRIW
ncbi:MAG: M13-type metalloendopeptidase [Acidimicrobiales bacterium]